MHQNSYDDTKFYAKKFKCFDNDIEIYGDYNSAKAKVLKIGFEKCNNNTIEPKNTCHSEEEIVNFLRRKFIMVV